MIDPVGRCVGRFAPSPTGPLHAGSLVAALASWLDVRAHDGGTEGQRSQWLVRIEDVDTPRCVPGADALILSQLAACGLLPDAPPVWQSQRSALYQAALDTLIAQGQAYGCACTRADIARAHEAAGLRKEKHGELVYPGTCRPDAQGAQPGLLGRTPRAWRLQVPTREAALSHWTDRRLGPQSQALDTAVGDFVVKRADGLWAYQLAVVVDDAAQGITHIVRGEDLADNTPRQIWLQRCLGLPTPSYLHTPLVRGANGEKLSKQNGAAPLDLSDPRAALTQAARVLGLALPAPTASTTVGDVLAQAVSAWPHR
ncbi:tRNA glutamyl-Q(34) synthetase GluQRS [Aquabacterium sp.]|uniref:tRNA glutamyl-Q(34) synthetase GluQRS n=1 Tax=Aquabacterium sp. TaxID=1872578 RepID=UPI002488A986|nr:tRNA glutamyl-Q(34) synthetase GluQRS [Aquabacterium sp.]MDI1351027.1 tRNA glutamyl-Q(34) synthetase GluQRS [Aquabacterium sp.]